MDVIRLDIFTDQEMQRVPEKPVRSYFTLTYMITLLILQSYDAACASFYQIMRFFEENVWQGLETLLATLTLSRLMRHKV